MDTIKIDKKNTKMVAHAGLFGMEAANTLAGVIAAGNRSYWGIEVDVRVTKDNEMVLIHNDDIFCVSGVEMSVKNSTLSELQHVTLYYRSHCAGVYKYEMDGDRKDCRSDLRISTLGEYIRLCKKYDKYAVVELKSEMTAENIACILKQFEDYEYLDKAVFISFMWESLVLVRRQAPKQRVQFLTDTQAEFSDEFLDKVKLAGFDLDINIFTTTKELIDRIHQRGMQVNVWTCDWTDKAEKLIEWGVDYITSNILE